MNRAKVTFDYEAEDETNITIRAGDIVVVTDKSDADWWEGHLEGKPDVVGFFPASFVELLDEVGDKLEGSVTTGEQIHADREVQKAMIETADNLPVSGEWQAGQHKSICIASGSEEVGSGADGAASTPTDAQLQRAKACTTTSPPGRRSWV